MKLILALGVFVLPAMVPAHAAAPDFSLVMVKDCGPGDVQRSFDAMGGALPFCLTNRPFLTAGDIAAARAIPIKQEIAGIANPHVLHLTLTGAAARRLTALTLDNRDESFAALVDDRIVSITSIGDPLRSTEVELLLSLDDPSFAALLTRLGKAP